MRTVLVTSGGGFQGMALIEALRQVPQTRIVLADCFEENVGRYYVARFLQAPLLKDEEAFLAFVEATCRQEAVDMVLPATELELDVLARGRDCIERIGAALASQAGMIGPLSTIAMSVWILGEAFTAWIAAGTVLVMTGVWLLTRWR